MSKEWISVYWKAFKENKERFFFGGPIESEFETEEFDRDILNFSMPSIRGLYFGEIDKSLDKDTPFVSANWACSRDALRKVGNFDLNKGLIALSKTVIAGEEIDIMQRLKDTGLRSYYLSKAKIKHFVPKTKLTLKHIAKRYKAMGFDQSRKDINIARGPFIFGVPRWLYKKIFKLYLRFILNRLRGGKAYRNYLELQQSLGYLKGIRIKKKEGSKLRIGYHANSRDIGGSDLYLKKMVANLDRGKYEVVLFCKREFVVEELFEGKVDFEIVYFDKGNRLEKKEPKIKSVQKRENLLRTLWRKLPFNTFLLLVGTVKDIIRMKALIKRANLDIFHSNDGGSEPMLIAARLAGVSVVVASYCVLPDPPEVKKIGTRGNAILEKISVNFLDKAIVKTQATKDMWVKKLGIREDRFEVIYNGLDLSIFNREPDIKAVRKELGISENVKIIGFSARFHPMKGHLYLIDAIPEIIKEVPNVVFLFVGEGEFREEIEKRVREKNVEEYIRFLGFRDDLNILTWVYDLAILPSVAYETFGWALIEAMACRKPTVATDFCGIPEVVEDGLTGILVPPKDSKALGSAIIELLKDKDRAKRMGEEGRKRVETLFTEEKMLKKTYGLYSRLYFRKKSSYKIAITSSGLGHTSRGIESWSKELAYSLDNKGIKVFLYKGGGKREVSIERVIPCIKRHSRLARFLKRITPDFMWRLGFGSEYQIEATTFTLNLLPELIINQYDIIHTQEASSAIILEMFKKIGLIKSKVILGHGTNESEEFLNKFETIQYLSPYDSEKFKNKRKNKKDFVIPNFVDVEKFNNVGVNGLRTKFRVPKDAFLILSVGMITEGKYKNMSYLIKEVAYLKKRVNRDIYLVIAGSLTHNSDDIMKFGRELLKDNIIFLVDYPHDSMSGLYASSDLFVLASLEEMMPIALLEALSSGLPCICHDYPVMKWILGNGGVCIDMTKDSKLSKKIEEYLDADLRKKFSIKARHQVIEHFSKEIVMNKTIDMYREVLK